MTIPFQNLRSAIPGAQPAQLDPGQVAFNVSDDTMYLGTGADTKIDFSGAVVTPNPPAGKGWVQVLLNRVALNDFFVQNPEAAGRPAPTNEQVLTYNATLGVAEWQDAGTGFAYATTNTAVAAAPGATTSQKITSAIGNPAYIGSNATAIVVGNPGETYEGLYIYNGTIWVFAAHYAFNTATQVPATNPTTLAASTTQAVLNALKLVDDGIQTQVTGNSLNIGVLQGQMATAQTDITGLQSSKLDKASNIPTPNQILSYDGVGQLWINDSQGDVTGVSGTGSITVNNTDPQNPVVGISAASTTAAGAVQLSNATNSVSEVLASTPLATKTAYDLADAAVPRSTYTAAGEIVVGTGVGTFGPLGIGTNGQVLTVVAGNPAWTDDSPGDVTSVTGTAPITVDNTDPQTPIVGVELATTATPGVVQVELTGNLTLVAGVIDVPDASTTVKGAVQLNNTLGSTSTTEALTAAQGNALQAQIDALTLSNSVTLAGGYDATTGLVDGVTSQGAAAGFLESATPPLPAAGNADYYLICTTSGSIPSAMENGDWLLSDGTQYVVLGVGARPSSASYTAAGIVQLADAAAVVAGTSDTLAITPQALQDNVIDSVTTANSSQIASATAVKTANDNAVAANTAAGNAQTTANNALPKAGGTMTGTITAQNVNVQGTYSLQFAGGVQGSLNAVTDLVNVTSSTTAASATAVKAANDAAVAAQTTANAALPRTGGTMTGNITFQDAGEGVVFNGGSQVFAISNSTSTTSSTTAASATAVKAAFDAAGTASGAAAAAQADATQALANAATAQTAADNAQADATQALADASAAQTDATQALADASAAQATANAAIPDAIFTAAGELLYGTGAATYNVLPIGVDGQQLIVSGGSLAWGQGLAGYTQSATPFNTAIGANAQDSLTSGAHNTAIGYNAASQLTSGGNNVAVGSLALDTASTAIQNTAVGYAALSGVTSSSGNTGIGYNALVANSTGAQNTAVGSQAGNSITTGSGHTVVGYLAGAGASGNGGNTAIGWSAMPNATSGQTTALGYRALFSLTSGAANTSLGYQAGDSITNGSSNVLVGYNAGEAITTGSGNTIIGSISGIAGLSANVILAAGNTVKFQANDTGAWSPDGTNYGTAGQVLTSQGTGGVPTWSDPSAELIGITSGDGQAPYTVALGFGAGDSALATGFYNVSIGYGAGTNITGGDYNVAVGGNALLGTGSSNTAVGTNAQGSTSATGQNNSSVGYQTLDALTSGAFNSTIGSASGTSVTSGARNTLLGYRAGALITTGGSNTILGAYEGTQTLSSNIVLSDGDGNVKLQINGPGAWSPNGTSYGTSGQVLTSNGTGAAPTWTNPAGPLPNYGSFLNTVSQTNLDTTNGNAATFNTTTENRNVSIVDGTKFTVAEAGTYNIQFSAQVTKTDAGSDDINIWFKKNGVNVANSAFNITLVGNNTPQLAASNFVLTLAAGDYVEIWWWSPDANVVLFQESAVAPYPAIPSIIATVVPVGA